MAPQLPELEQANEVVGPVSSSSSTTTNLLKGCYREVRVVSLKLLD